LKGKNGGRRPARNRYFPRLVSKRKGFIQQRGGRVEGKSGISERVEGEKKKGYKLQAPGFKLKSLPLVTCSLWLQ
jgi:hypothetical protein